MEESILTADYPDEYEMATNQLASGSLAAQPQSLSEEVDWLLKLRTKTLGTQELFDDALVQQPAPSGMAAHTAPAKILPTRGARFSTGLRRGTLMIALSALAAGALAGGGYLLASTPWVSSLFASPVPPAASQQTEAAAPQVAPLPDTSGLRDSHDIDRGPQNPDEHPGGGMASDEAAAISGLDARNLRDKGIAAYRAGNYTDAVKYLEESVSVSSDDPIAQYQLGLSYMSVQGRTHALEDAEFAFRTAVSLQPQWAAPYQMMAETMMRRGYYEQAVDPALQATRLDPTMGEAWMTLGRAYSGAGNEAEATKAFAQAARFAPAPAPAQKP